MKEEKQIIRGNEAFFACNASIGLRLHFIFGVAPMPAGREHVARIVKVIVPRAKASGTLPVHGTSQSGRAPLHHALRPARVRLERFR
jgi:hypothetical protein